MSTLCFCDSEGLGRPWIELPISYASMAPSTPAADASASAVFPATPLAVLRSRALSDRARNATSDARANLVAGDVMRPASLAAFSQETTGGVASLTESPRGDLVVSPVKTSPVANRDGDA